MNRKPNFLILLTDQQRYDTIHAAGFPHMITPNLDRLVREGCLFTRAYSPNPICVPARHYLLTGNPASEHGYFDNGARDIADPELPTIAGVFTGHGYRTAAIGKCHFHPVKTLHGYEETHLMEELPVSVEEDAYLQHLNDKGYNQVRNIHGIRPLIYHETQRALMDEANHGTNWVADRTIQWIEENGEAPFLLTANWIKPHPPWNIPPSKTELYEQAALPDPIPRSRSAPFPTNDSVWYGDGDSAERKREIREAYYTCVTMVDEAIGRVLQYLEKKDILDDTVIIFTSDHGEMLQDKGFYQKAFPYESSARIPLLMRYPPVFTPGSRQAGFADLMDIFPTCLDIADIPYPEHGTARDYQLAGGSLVPGSKSPWQRNREEQFCDCLQDENRWVMLRDERYKYIHYFKGGHEYLYDLQDDPGECHNLLEKDTVPDCYAQLRARCLAYERERGPGGTLDGDDFVTHAGDYEAYDWNNGDKYPKWCFAQFQTFGNTFDEAERFLTEWREATADWDDARLADLPLHDDAKAILLENYKQLGGGVDAILKALGSQ